MHSVANNLLQFPTPYCDPDIKIALHQAVTEHTQAVRCEYVYTHRHTDLFMHGSRFFFWGGEFFEFLERAL